MTEDFLHFIWQFGLFDRTNLKAETGEEIDIISTGQLNYDAGPDFFNARVRINGMEWAGNVEIHIRASDWNRHGHFSDAGYNNVILHVVEEPDSDTFTEKGAKIPTIKLNYNKNVLENYLHLYRSKNRIACSKHLQSFDSNMFNLFISSIAIERLENKTVEIREKLIKSSYNWEDVFYKCLAKNFGFRVNSLPFGMLADAVPLKAIAKQKNNLHQIEALLFGQSGLLPAKSEQSYIKSLQAEYVFLKSKFDLKPLQKEIWKYLRVRPVNFPSVRIAQFASLIHQSSALFSRIIETDNPESVIRLFSVNASEYWNTHYDFEKPSPDEPKNLGREAILTLIINTIVPFVFLYGREKGKPELTERALKFMELIPAEKNKIVRSWAETGKIARTALESQALIQLYNFYCLPGKCLQCRIGTTIIKATRQPV